MIKKQTIEKYVRNNTQSKIPFKIWLAIINKADWNEPSDILYTFSNANILGRSSKRVVFNIGGNKYRIICHYHFGKKHIHLFINWIGTHAEYTKLCLEQKQYTVNDY